MPGTVKISVLDILDLPLSSAQPSSTSIRVTMGRREYDAPENGEFSIPLTTLRENLIVKLISSDGQEISHTDVETRLVVEKGIWDEIFYLAGGGKIHLKMQFVLSEEEQSRIRMMRLSALKKKHGELVNDSSKGPQKAAAVGRDTATGLTRNRGISGSLSGLEEGPSQGVLAPQSLKLQSNAISEVTKNHPDKTEDTSAVFQQKAEASIAESDSNVVLDKRENRSPPEAATIRDLPGERASSSSNSNVPATTVKSSLTSYSKVEQDAARKTLMRSPQEKTPSNVRKMIGVFETSLAQDKRPRIKPPPTKLKPSKHEMEVCMSSQQSKEHTDERAPKVGTNGASIETDFSSQDTAVLEFNMRNVEGLSASRNQHSELPEKSGREEEMGTASISGRAPEKETCDVKESWNAKTQTSGKNGEMKLSIYHENMVEYPGEGPRGWMFLDEPGNFCLTTGGKKIMHLMEGQSIKSGNCQAKRDIMDLNTQGKPVGVISKSDIEMDDRGLEKASANRQSKPKSGGAADADHSGGPLGQAMKIAIMVGFGALVLLTRQRRDRKKKCCMTLCSETEWHVIGLSSYQHTGH